MVSIAPAYLDLPQNEAENTSYSHHQFKFVLKKQIESIVSDYQMVYDTCEFIQKEKDLQESVNYLASSCFNKEWKDEDDDYWNSYL